MWRKLIPLVLFGITALLLLMADSCADESHSGARTKAVDERWDTYDRAKAQYPDPQTVNFPLRQALVKMTERQDAINHPWYIYILGDNGNVIGYYVGQTVPVNACDFLSSTENVRDDSDGNLVLTAPSLDGVFYGGAGSSSGCDAWFFFDYATDALIQIRGVHFYAADQPLTVNAEPINVQAQP